MTIATTYPTMSLGAFGAAGSFGIAYASLCMAGHDRRFAKALENDPIIWQAGNPAAPNKQHIPSP